MSGWVSAQEAKSVPPEYANRDATGAKASPLNSYFAQSYIFEKIAKTRAGLR